MANWSDLHSYIKSHYKVTDDKIDSVKLLFDLEDGRTQAVIIERAGELGGSEWAVISTAVCAEGGIDPRTALVRNSEMTMGGLALVDGGPVIFRHSIRLADLDPNEFEDPLKVAIFFGDSLELELTGADQF